MCVREANDPVRNDHADSKFSWNQSEVAHPLLSENTGQIFYSSRPPCMSTFAWRHNYNGVSWLVPSRVSLDRPQDIIGHCITYVRGHIYNKGTKVQRYKR